MSWRDNSILQMLSGMPAHLCYQLVNVARDYLQTKLMRYLSAKPLFRDPKTNTSRKVLLNVIDKTYIHPSRPLEGVYILTLLQSIGIVVVLGLSPLPAFNPTDPSPGPSNSLPPLHLLLCPVLRPISSRTPSAFRSHLLPGHPFLDGLTGLKLLLSLLLCPAVYLRYPAILLFSPPSTPSPAPR
jgi:hypothetical protein